MRPKVIDKSRLKLDEQTDFRKRLSYDMVFVDKSELDEDLERAVSQNNAEWEQRLIKERQKAVDQGYAAGFEDGKQKAIAEIDAHLGTFEQALHQLEHTIQETTMALKPAIHSMVFELAEKIIGVPVESEELRAKVTFQIESFLKELEDDHKAIIHVSDTDFDSVQHLKEKITHLRHLLIERDEKLMPGEFRVESNHTSLLHSFKKSLQDFKSSAKLPDWTEGEV